jgi:uncharacterized protein (TIGR00730 family)
MKAGIDEQHFRVVIFGSARIEEGDDNWELIYRLAERIAEEGMDLVTGGGPGLMDAAPQGHYRGDMQHQAHSIGLQILLPDRQRDAEHLDLKKEITHFSTRLDNFIELANAVVVAPGGIGTLLELFYTWQLMQVQMIRNIPVILLRNMWKELMGWIEKWPLKAKLLDKEDVDLLFLVNDIDEALAIIKKAGEEHHKR